ncbi:MAG: T9SS type A sorting domain-containing protein [Paludibacter sp.]|nr:T9SS type A sorting domain-containing protein [Paludibacter sp.]
MHYKKLFATIICIFSLISLHSADTVLLFEDFVKANTLTSTAKIPDVNTVTSTPGWIGVEICGTNGSEYVRIGSNSVQGSLSTPALDLTGIIRLTFKIQRAQNLNDLDQFEVHLDNVPIARLTIDKTFQQETIYILNGKSSSRISFAAIQASYNKAFIDDIKIERCDPFTLPIVDALPGSRYYFGSAKVNNTKSKSFEVKGVNLQSNDMTFTLSGTDAEHFIAPEAITPTSGGISQNVYVRYKPKTAGSHTATLTIKSGSSNIKTCILTGDAVTGDEVVVESMTFHGKKLGIYNNKLSDILEDGGTVFLILKNNGNQSVEIAKNQIMLQQSGNLTALPTLENSSRNVGWSRMWPQNPENNNGILNTGERMALTINFAGKNPVFRDGSMMVGGIQLTPEIFVNFPEEQLITPELRIGSIVPGRDWRSMTVYLRNTSKKNIFLTQLYINGALRSDVQIIGDKIVPGGVGIMKVGFDREMKAEQNLDIVIKGTISGSEISVGYPLRMMTEAWIPIGTWESNLAEQDNATILEMRNLLIDVYWKAPFSDLQRSLYDRFHIATSASVNLPNRAVNQQENPSFCVWQCGEEPELSGLRGLDVLNTTYIHTVEKKHPTYLNLCENRRFSNFAHINEIICMDHYGIGASTNFTSGWDPDNSSVNGLHAVMDLCDQLKDNSEPQRMWIWSQLAFDSWTARPFGNYWQAWAEIGSGAKGLLWFVMKKGYTSSNSSLVAAAKRFTQEFSSVRGLCTYSETMKQTDTYACGSGTSAVSFSVKTPLQVLSPVPVSNKANRKLLAKALVNEEAVLLIILNNNMTSSTAISTQSGSVEITIPDWIPIEDIWEVSPTGKKAISNYTINERTLTFNVSIGSDWPVLTYVIGKTDTTVPETPEAPVIVDNGGNSIILSWKDVFDNYGVRGYKVFYNDSQIANVDVPYFEIANINDYTGDLKKFSIRAYDANGNHSVMSPYAIINNTTTINELQESSSINVIVNREKQMILISNVENYAQVQLINFTGQIYQSAQVSKDSETQIDISGLPKGAYLIRLKHEKGEEVMKILI